MSNFFCFFEGFWKITLRPVADAAFFVAFMFASVEAVVAGATEKPALTTALFEKRHVSPHSKAQLQNLVSGNTLTFMVLATETRERIFYGARRFDEYGGATTYRISNGAIEEESKGVPHLLLLYNWRGRTFGCLENVGDLDELGDAEGTCPYEIIKISKGNHLRGG